MKLKLLEILVCPHCASELFCNQTMVGMNEEIIEGYLKCSNCPNQYPIESGIPRFVNQDNYASSFGYQWHKFKLEQVDSFNQTNLSEKRFYSETGWTSEWMKGKWILEVGCGAGRFLDIASKNSCEVVAVDITNAVDAAKENFGDRENIHFVQASIYELPFRAGVFDGCYCIGVIQHTPHPEAATKCLPKVLKIGGKIAVTIYERKPWTLLNGKYLIRPLTKRLNKKAFLASLKLLMPGLFVLTEVLFRLPVFGRLFRFSIPIANYVNEVDLSLKQRYDWAILDTFDMLSPEYDQPQTRPDVEKWLSNSEIIDIQHLNHPGVNLIGQKGK